MACFLETLDCFRESGFDFGVATVLHSMGDIVLFQGDAASAKAWYVESLTLLYRQNAWQRIVWPLAGLAAIAAVEGRAVRAISLWAAADALRASINSIDYTMSYDRYRQRVDAGRAGLDPDTIRAAEAAGGGLSFDQAVAFARASEPEPA